MSEYNILKNRAECMNNVKGYINEIAPQIIKELEKGFSITRNCELFKKDKTRIDAVIKSKKIFRAILYITEYSIYLKVDARYQVSEHAVAYYKESVYLWNVKPNYEAYNVEPRELVSYQQLKNAKIELARLEDEKSAISSRISKLERLLR